MPRTTLGHAAPGANARGGKELHFPEATGVNSARTPPHCGVTMQTHEGGGKLKLSCTVRRAGGQGQSDVTGERREETGDRREERGDRREEIGERR